MRTTLGCAIIFACSAASAQDRYMLIDVGDLGGPTGNALCVSDEGHVVGAADDAQGRRRAYIYHEGEIQELALPDEQPLWQSEVYGVTDAGEVVGAMYDESLRPRALAWDEAGHVRELGTLGGPTSTAYAINSLGQIVGAASIDDHTSVGFLWLPVAAHGFQAGMNRLDFAFDINDFTQICGAVQNEQSGRWNPALWLPGAAYGMEAGLNEIVLGGEFAERSAAWVRLNAGAMLTGTAYDGGGESIAFVWLPEPRHGLGAGFHRPPPVDPEERDFSPTGLNDRGMVVGSRWYLGEPPNEFEDPPTIIEGVVYIPGRGSFDLTPRVVNSDYEVVYAQCINNHGEIVASAIDPRRGYRGVLLVPVCPADLTDDGALDTRDVIRFLSDYAGRLPTADWAGPYGEINTLDALAYLRAFAQGC